MARRARSAGAGAGLIVAALVIGALGKGLEFLKALPSDAWAIIFVIIIGVAFLLIVCRLVHSIQQSRARKAAGRKAANIIKEHLPSLVRRRAQLVREDAYGKPLLENWYKEIGYFIDQHIVPAMTLQEHLAFTGERAEVAGMIYMLVETERDKNPAFLSFSDKMTPSEFETFCAEELRRAGWNARVTMQSRDQGVDVVADKNGIRVVLQCKLYARPVGNKSVQEASAARAHEQANYGIVVSNNRYTQDAEQLAATNRILLLHYSDLRNLDAVIRRRSRASDAWYYHDGAGNVGPLALQDLRDALATFADARNVLVWEPAFRDWKPARQVSELREQSGVRTTRASTSASSNRTRLRA